MSFRDSKIADKSFAFLKYSSMQNYKTFFEKLLNLNHISKYFFENSTTIFYINLKTTTSDLDFQKANEYYLKTDQSKSLIFIIDTKTQDFESLILNSPLNYQLCTKAELFKLMKQTNTYPIDISNYSKLKTLKLPNFSLSKTKFKELFFSGISLLAISIVIPYTLYYLLTGTFLLTLSIICLFKKAPPATKQKQTLESLLKEKGNVIKT